MFISKLVNRDYYNRANLIYATLFSIIVAAMPGIHPEEVNAKRLLVAFGIWGIPVIVYGFYFSVKFLMMSKEKFHIPIIIGGFSLIFLGGFDILQLLQGKLIYQISYSGIGFLLFLVFAFLALILKDHQNEIDKVLFDLKIHQATSQLAKQVSHDIRSPLAALKMALDEVENIPEEHRALIRSSVSRINDIANQLLEKGKQVKNDISLTIPRTSEMELTPQLLSPIIETLVSEKRVQFRDKQEIHIEAKVAKGYGLFANLNASEFKRVLSNLINNSCEAFTHPSGKVDVTLMSDAKNIIITIQDNGKGIPQHILKKLGEKGVSYGKEGTQSGSGLGVYHAKKTVESFGGKFEIISTEGQGTTIQMTFDRAPAPKWFEEKLSLLPSMQIISLDDDLSIHQIWKRRFESLKVIDFNIVHFTFTSGDEFREFVKKQNNTNQLYLVDYELLNQNATGLNLIEELNLGPQSILITSRYEEHQIRERCDTLGVKLIPKSMAASVPIEISKVKIKYDIILLDDDQLTRMTWEM
jgi:signal transduction histidine kinase